MVKLYIKKDGNRLYIKDIDYANTKLTFTDDKGKATTFRDGYYVKPTIDMIKRGFKEDYPEVETLEYTCDY